ncbi:Z385B protein, partial [Nothocercus nigrocapillus]|nr:Z385B protein [Nothocercus nigrocapillus]
RSPEAERAAEPAGCAPEQRAKRERKQPSFTLCDVCNIQLNSAAQAQIHCNGKSHQKRLKQLNKGKAPAAQARSGAFGRPGRVCRAAASSSALRRAGPAGHSSPLLASLPIPGRPLHTPLDIKHFLTFRLNGTSPLNLFPNFNTVSGSRSDEVLRVTPVPRASGGTAGAFGKAPRCSPSSSGQTDPDKPGQEGARRARGLRRRRGGWRWLRVGRPGERRLCPGLRGGGDASATSHPRAVPATPSRIRVGARGAWGLCRALGPGAASQRRWAPPSCFPNPAGDPWEAPGRPRSRLGGARQPRCPLPAGAKHKSMLEGHSAQLRRGRGRLLARAGHKAKRIGNKGSINIQNKAFHCQVCEIYVNSETQLKQHMSSRRHKDRLAGKPPKPKYSPYNKLQKNAALA